MESSLYSDLEAGTILTEANSANNVYMLTNTDNDYL